MEQIETEITEKNIGDLAGRGASNLIKMTGGQMAALLVGAVSGFIIPRVLGPENFGQYVAVMAPSVRWVRSFVFCVRASNGSDKNHARFICPLRFCCDPSSPREIGE